MTLRLDQQLTVAIALIGLLQASNAWAASATRTSAFAYDPVSGLLTDEIIEPDQDQFKLVTTYTYDAYGNKTQATVSSPATGEAAIATRSSSTGFDTQGRFATSATNALNQSETRVYDARFGTVTSLTGPNNLTTTWTYDAFGRKTLETRADGTKTKWEYLFCAGVNGGVASCPSLAKYLVQTTPLAADGTTQNGPWTKTYFDVLNREIRTETQGFAAAGTAPLIYVDTIYDSKGRVEKKSRPYFSGETPLWTVVTYDAIGRAVTETYPDSSTSTTTYDGLTTTVTNELGQTRTKVRNSQGQVISVTEGKTGVLTASTTFEYDPFGNLTKTTDAAGNVSTLSYDLRGRKIAMSDPDMGTWTYVYDVLGQLKSQTDAKGQVTTMTYDVLGRMVSRTEPDVDYPGSNQVSAWTYDTASYGIGKLAEAKIVNGNTSTSYQRTHSYDDKGRPISVAISVGGVAPYTIAATYDVDGRIDTITYPSGAFAVKHVYTALGYLQEVRNAATSAHFWRAEAMNAERQLTQFQHGNGVVTTQVFEATTGRLTGIQAGPGNAVQNLSYTYDALSNLTSRTDTAQNPSQPLTETFLYDALNRLTEATIVDGPTKTVQYDLVGNITFKSDVGTYTYPAAGPTAVRPHAVSSVTGAINATYTYDANGNMVAGNGRTVTWTSFNMVREITQGANTLSFLYDTERQRTRQVAPDGSTLYLNAFGIRAEYFASPSLTQWNNYVFVGAEIVAVHHDRSVGTDTTRYFHKDHLGSISVITDEAGAVTQRLAYDAWGKRRYPNGADDATGILESQAETDRGFTGHEHLQEVGLIHMNGRIYDPVLARSLSADPFIQDPFHTQAINRYAYVNNNPLAYTDPTGFFFKKVFKSIQKFFQKNPVLAFVVGAATAWATGGISFLATGVEITWGGAITAGAVTGGLTGGVKGAILGGISGAVTFGIGDLGLGFLGNAEFLVKAALHGVAQGAFAEIQGGEFGSAFLSAAFSKVALTGLGSIDAFKGDSVGAVIGNVVASAVIGGTASVIGGGKFQNGAATAAFVYLFNEATRKAFTNKSLRFDSLDKFRDALKAQGEGAYTFGDRPLSGVVVRLFGKIGGYFDRNNIQDVHEHFFWIDGSGNVRNSGYFDTTGVGPDPGFPGNIQQYRFEPIQRGGAITDMVLNPKGFGPNDYHLLKNNCQHYCDAVRNGLK